MRPTLHLSVAFVTCAFSYQLFVGEFEIGSREPGGRQPDGKKMWSHLAFCLPSSSTPSTPSTSSLSSPRLGLVVVVTFHNNFSRLSPSVSHSVDCACTSSAVILCSHADRVIAREEKGSHSCRACESDRHRSKR